MTDTAPPAAPQAPLVTRRLAADEAGIAAAAALLAAGRLVAFPTETVYGLGGDATNGPAIAALYAAKGRPRFNPLIAHVPDLAAARRLAAFSPLAERIAAAFWPGPLTLVLPLRPEAGIADLVTAGLDSVAIRVPAHPLARRLLAAVGRPVAAPSANLSGRVSPTTAAHVLEDLDGRIDAVLDGGPADVGVESTIVEIADDTIRLLRPGGIARAALAAVAGQPIGDPAGASPDAPRAPGMLASHYAPAARVRLDATAVAPGEALLAFGAPYPAGAETAVATIDLSPGRDLGQAATRLFAALRALDRSGAAAIAVAPIPADGLGEAIRDRLTRAAAPR